MNAENLTLRLAPTDEDWVADPVDEANVISNFQSDSLERKEGGETVTGSRWAEYQLETGVTGWAKTAAWSRGRFGLLGPILRRPSYVDLACSQSELLPPHADADSRKGKCGMNPVRFESSRGYIQSEALELDDESVFFAFQVVRAEWSLANANLENNGRII